jgi:basic amino acid/polyamine antiporter, APA family
MLSKIPQLDRGTLRRVLGVCDLFAIGFGDLGASIYYALGVTAFFALGATPLAMLLAGIVFVCTALSYAEMSSIFQEGGGAASYVRHAFNDLFSFIAGWGLLLDYIVTIAISSFTIGPYLSVFFPFLHHSMVQIFTAIFLILSLMIVNIFGVKQSTRISFVLMVFTIFVQVSIIVIGFFAIEDFSKIFRQMKINEVGVSWSPDWGNFIKGTAMAMVAYTGIESIAQLGGESKRPLITVPRAVMITTVILLILYFGIAFVGFSVLTPMQMGHAYKMEPLVGIALHLPWGGRFLAPCVGVLAAVTLFVAANAGLVGASRLSFHMGEYYQIPRMFYATHSRYRTPYIAIIFFALLASIVVALSRAKMSFLADLYNFGAQIAFLFTHISVIALRIKNPGLLRPFRIPLNIRIYGKAIPIPAILGVFSSFFVWLLVVITKPYGRYVGFTWIFVGVIMYYYYRKKKHISPTANIVLQKIEIPRAPPLEIKNILLPLKSSQQTALMQIACEMAKFYRAKIITTVIIEVPFSLPLTTLLPFRTTAAEMVLKTAMACASEVGVEMETEIIRSRHIVETIVDIVKNKQCDLIVLEMRYKVQSLDEIQIDKVIKAAPCNFWIYTHPSCVEKFPGKNLKKMS